jgi:hypothetical protein
LLQLHVWNDAWADQGDWRDAVGLSRRAPRFVGVSINDHEPANSLRLIESGALTQVIYNVFDESPEDDHRSQYFRGDRPREVHERVARIAGRSKRNVERNVAASDGQGLDERRREKLRAHRWLRNFYR